MEHSYVGNNFVSTFASQLINSPKRVVWAGDYADAEKGTEGKGYEGRGENLYDFATDENKIKPKEVKPMYDKYPYLVNHTKKEIVNINRMPKNDGWEIHPLPLLTCEGNGRGGGDYRGNIGAKFIGSWARDLISLEAKKPKGYKLIKPNFIED